MSSVPNELEQIKRQVALGENPSASVRQLLYWFGYERRGWRIVNHIDGTLSKLGLRTEPNYEFAWIDRPVKFVRIENEVKTSSEPTDQVTDSENSVEPACTPPLATVGGAPEDPTYRIGKLDAANKVPKYISPDASMSEAVTVMLRDDFSQLPVMTSDREVKGVITWRSIASHLALGRSCPNVRDCMDKHVEIVDEDTSLFRVIDQIADNDFVLVRNRERRIIGIVTVSDLSQSFHQLGRPFLLLSEIENHIRGIIDGHFSVGDLREVRNPADIQREINSVSDLTFGEYVRLLQNPSKWEVLGLALDRSTFVADLERVNAIRNDVMHFDPDGIGREDLEQLRKASKFVQEVRDLVRA